MGKVVPTYRSSWKAAIRLKPPNGRDVTKRAIIDVNSIVSGRNYDILTSYRLIADVTAIR